MIAPLRNNRGMALLLTVLIISLLMVVIVEFNRAMRSDLQSAVNLRDSIKLVNIARSAFNSAQAILHADGLENDYDTLHETWANMELFSAFGNSFFDDGTLSVRVADQSGRIQINALVNSDNSINATQRTLFARFLSSTEFELEPEDIDNILDAIKDWLDTDDDVSGFGGAENSFYQALAAPHDCRNGPMEFPEELLLVRGISRELLYGTKERPGIIDFVTPYGNNGKININTAPPLVLLALHDQINSDMVDNMITYRDNEDNDDDLASPTWYKHADEFPGDITIEPGLITTSSSFFEIIATGMAATVSRTISGVVRRDAKKKPAIVTWKQE